MAHSAEPGADAREIVRGDHRFAVARAGRIRRMPEPLRPEFGLRGRGIATREDGKEIRVADGEIQLPARLQSRDQIDERRLERDPVEMRENRERAYHIVIVASDIVLA